MGEACASSFGIVLHLLAFAFSVQHAWRWSVFVVVLVDGPWKHMGLVAARTPAQPSRMTPALAGRKRLQGSICIQLWHCFASSRVGVHCTVCLEMVCFCCCPRRWALETHGSCRSTDTSTAIALSRRMRRRLDVVS